MIREFLRTDYARVVAAVAMVAGSRPSAEDAVQEALLRAWQRSERGHEMASLTAWVTAVALNLSRSRVRRVFAERRAQRRLGPGPASPSEDERLDLLAAIRRLPRRQREVVVLRYLLEMDTRETAQALGVGEGTVKRSLSDARQALAETLGVRDAEEVDDVEA